MCGEANCFGLLEGNTVALEAKRDLLAELNSIYAISEAIYVPRFLFLHATLEAISSPVFAFAAFLLASLLLLE